MIMDKWAISDNEENFSCQLDSKEEAIEEGKAIYDGSFYVGRCVEYKPDISADRIFDDLNENAYDNLGEYVDDWPCVTKEHTEIFQQRLDKLLADFLKEFCYEPTFFTVENIEMIGRDDEQT